MTTDSKTRQEGLSPERPPCKVLFVDANRSVRQSAKAFLDAAGYSVALAVDGYEALASVAHSIPDIVIADIVMPRLDGYQMCLLLKSNSEYQHIPVIMLFGGEVPFDKERAQQVGSESHVPKPITAQALATALKDAHQKISIRTSTHS